MAGFIIAQDVGTSQKISGFLMKGIDLCIIVESACLWWKENPEFSLLPSC